MLKALANGLAVAAQDIVMPVAECPTLPAMALASMFYMAVACALMWMACRTQLRN